MTASYSSGNAHDNGDCWPSQCPICIAEDETNALPDPDATVNALRAGLAEWGVEG